ncbi:hypothetical protein ARAM_001451 [Aspergillus rambellii]|uniref:RNA-dependent RNA polymerase n=1 Tax=Aspergillus rambellii TaxID=308745 RepID=A0A0F8VU00_9EURO|nr:hypothetical protein ARAM_001451 [Aspergillus rambellii]
MNQPRTPASRSGKELSRIIDSINDQFSLEIPNPRLFSPAENRHDTPQWRSYRGLQRLYYNRSVEIYRVLNSFEEWVCSRNASNVGLIGSTFQKNSLPALAAGLGKRNRDGNGRAIVTQHEKKERLAYLVQLIDDELYMVDKGSFPRLRNSSVGVEGEEEKEDKAELVARPLKRRLSNDLSSDEFVTAPNSPVKNSNSGRVGLREADRVDENPIHMHKTPKTAESAKKVSKFLERLTAASDKVRRYEAVTSEQDNPNLSFSTIATDPVSYAFDSRNEGLQTSFNSTITFATDPMADSESASNDSVDAYMLGGEATLSRDSTATGRSLGEPRYCAEGEIMEELLCNGPFSYEQSLPASVPLLYRYELERIGRAWGVDLKQMLVGDSISFGYDKFWKWIEGHNQRYGKSIPEKPSRKAWDAASGTFKTSKHSEVVVLTGDLDWCSESEKGILKMKLNPLKTERSCRFHRRFGSDRFLSLTIPAPSRPPNYLRLPDHPALLRESIALWLTRNVHRFLGRMWKPFFVEDAKSKTKTKAEPRFRVNFFAIDGIDFSHQFHTSNRLVPPTHETAESHTRMTLESLVKWHMSPTANVEQTNLKLFQRMSIGLSKTFATVVLKPKQILYLRDVPNTRVMNDGCALMSRQLANKICDSLGISGNTPSGFQGRIAGAKGLWMVDTHQSQISADGDNVWIQISDSQLKIKPHPREWQGSVDDEQLTFEVVKWSKPLHPVDLNTQLLAILDHGGHVKGYIADLARLGIQTAAQGFEEVLKANSPIVCRSLAQKLKPTADSGAGFMLQSVRRLEQWPTDDVETIIRFSEAGFSPRSFYPLRKRLRRCLETLLKRYVEELHIEVPLSTYAFCIADPYGVLKEDEVHFGLSTNWRDDNGQFEDNLLDGMDVLVGRLPAHLPSDIQRRKAVWKPELRHFKDVIVFPTTGEIPLADMLSGGDYDGDTPWICWDQNIVGKFQNSSPPGGIENYPPEYFGLTRHSVPMREIQSTDEFLESSFAFNLTLSNLGRCTVEHEKLSYDESIDSRKAIELSYLLSHLVDGRKGGVTLSEIAWQQYRKQISPIQRELPAYKNPQRKHNRNNIIDFIRFEVAQPKQKEVLRQLEKDFPETESAHQRDEDLLRPWKEAQEAAAIDRNQGDGGSLHRVLKETAREIDDLYFRWCRLHSRPDGSFSPRCLEAADQARTIPPPTLTVGTHPLIHIWQHSQPAWFELMASYTYRKYPQSSFVIRAFGETLCQIKSRDLSSRTVTHEILACYRVNQKVIARLRTQDAGDEEFNEEMDSYEGYEAIEAMLYGAQGRGGYYDPDDSLSVE